MYTQFYQMTTLTMLYFLTILEHIHLHLQAFHAHTHKFKWRPSSLKLLEWTHKIKFITAHTMDQNHQLEWVSLIFAHCGIDTLRLFFRGRPHCKHASQITKLMVISELGSQTAGIAELGSAYMICAYQWLAQISLACHFEILQSRFNFSQVL